MDYKNTIYVVENVCGCRLCKGTARVTSDIEKDVFNLFNAGKLQLQAQGARKPTHFYAPIDFEFISVSANSRPYSDPSRGYVLFGVYADSVHSCGKIKRCCSTEIWIPESKINSVNVVLTREFEYHRLMDYDLKVPWHYFITPTGQFK